MITVAAMWRLYFFAIALCAVIELATDPYASVVGILRKWLGKLLIRVIISQITYLVCELVGIDDIPGHFDGI